MHLNAHTTDRSPRRNPWPTLALATTFAIAAPAQAGTVITTDNTLIDSSVTTEVKTSVFEKIWGLATLCKDDANPIVQEVKLRGRYHTQYYWVENEDSPLGDDLSEDDREDRRSRIGFDIKMFNKKIEIRADVESTDGFEPKYGGLVDVYVKWKPSEAFNLTVGR